jgi:hypothetical protein
MAAVATTAREFSTQASVCVSIKRQENDEGFFQAFASFMVRSSIRVVISTDDRDWVRYFFTTEDAEKVVAWLSEQENTAQVNA